MSENAIDGPMPAPISHPIREAARNSGIFAGTMILFLLINAGIVWWARELTGLSARHVHTLISAGLVIVLTVSWIAEFILTRRGAHAAAQVMTSIVASACLFAAGNGIMARVQGTNDSTAGATLETPSGLPDPAGGSESAATPIP